MEFAYEAFTWLLNPKIFLRNQILMLQIKSSVNNERIRICGIDTNSPSLAFHYLSILSSHFFPSIFTDKLMNCRSIYLSIRGFFLPIVFMYMDRPIYLPIYPFAGFSLKIILCCHMFCQHLSFIFSGSTYLESRIISRIFSCLSLYLHFTCLSA